MLVNLLSLTSLLRIQENAVSMEIKPGLSAFITGGASGIGTSLYALTFFLIFAKSAASANE